MDRLRLSKAEDLGLKKFGKHGEDAVFHAAFKADEVLERGSIDGQLWWTRLMRAVKLLQRTEPGEGERHH